MSHVSIRVSTLRGDQKIAFDAYLKINDKYVLYIRKGDAFDGPRLQRLREKKLKKMFIQEDDESQYRDYMSRNIEMAFDSNSGAKIETRSEIVQGVQQSNTEQVMENPADAAAYAEAKDSAAKFSQFLAQEDAALSHILKIENVDKNIAHHGVTVSTLANALAKRLGLTDPKQLQILSLGALLHDFDHFGTGLNVARPLAAMPPEDLKIYKDHPMSGGRKVQEQKHFDAAVMNIIVQHEEFIDGQGFPQGLNESQLDPLSVMVSSANALDRLLAFEGMPRKEAAKHLMLHSLGRHPLKQLQLLSEIIQTLD